MEKKFKELADGTIVEYSEEDYARDAMPAIAPTETAVREHRDNILRNEVDPMVSNALRWASYTPEQQQAWANYRQALLDIPQQAGFPHDVVWPTKP